MPRAMLPGGAADVSGLCGVEKRDRRGRVLRDQRQYNSPRPYVWEVEGAGMDEMFEAFWAAYPRRVGKGAARAAFDKACRKATPEAIIAAVTAQVYAGCFRDLTFCPHPATWLNGERWDDEIATALPKTAAHALAVRFRSAALAGDDAGKEVVKVEARKKGIAWLDVMEAMQALRASEPISRR